MTRIAVVGPGGVGTFFAAHLASAGHDVVACARRHFTTYQVESDTAPTSGPAVVVTAPEEVSGPMDWVLVGVKAHQTPGVAGWLARLCGPDTMVVTLQNGIEAERRFEPYVSGARVLEAVVYCGAELLAPGHTRNRGGGLLIVPDVDESRALAGLYADTPVKIKPDPEHLTQKWRKLGINVAVNGVTALTDKPISVAGSGPGRIVARAILDECWTVARAEGVDLPADAVEGVLDGMANLDGTTSMRQDRVAGRPTEHDALYGAVVRHGARHGIPTPVNEAIGAVIAAGD